MLPTLPSSDSLTAKIVQRFPNLHSCHALNAASGEFGRLHVLWESEGVQGVLTLFCSGAAQVCHDDRVVELKEQPEVEE